eukprot:Phypoly_transcript_03719.p2 GENE.Phypoly_transcript_03719~~Phypoly_transcript_03719.p2  ORF type:complete len:105 (+),score=13.52 Phypoly_transcript_03719:1781-2095(+)
MLGSPSIPRSNKLPSKMALVSPWATRHPRAQVTTSIINNETRTCEPQNTTSNPSKDFVIQQNRIFAKMNAISANNGAGGAYILLPYNFRTFPKTPLEKVQALRL